MRKIMTVFIAAMMMLGLSFGVAGNVQNTYADDVCDIAGMDDN